MVFRFLLNVDHCLLMEKYDYFFYELQSNDEMMLFPNVRLGNGSTLHENISDIRIHLDKNSHAINDHQIVFAMRGRVKENYTWRESMLYRILSINYELQKANIYTSVANNHQCVVSIIALHEKNVIRNINNSDSNYIEKTFSTDFKLLLEELNICDLDNVTAEDIRTNLAAYYKNPHKDVAVTYVLDKVYNQLKDMNVEGHDFVTVFYESLFDSIKGIVTSFQIFEMVASSHNFDESINAVLRIVKYITDDFKASELMGLPEVCKAKWSEVEAIHTDDLCREYVEILTKYETKLSSYLEADSVKHRDNGKVKKFVNDNVPSETDIGQTITFGYDAEGKVKTIDTHDPQLEIEKFKKTINSTKGLMARWVKTHDSIKAIVDDAQREFENYESELGRQYTSILVKRKEETIENKDVAYEVDDNMESIIKERTKLRDDIIDRLRDTNLMPTKMYQDQLNLKSKLEEIGDRITHYINRLQSASGKSFLILFAIVELLIAVFYAIMQPYAVFKPSYFIGYLVIVALILLSTWGLHISYYKKKIKNETEALSKSVKECMQGYIDSAKQMSTYINLINQLDFLDRDIKTRESAIDLNKWKLAVINWYVDEAKSHLMKIKFFDGMIRRYRKPSSSAPAVVDINFLPEINNNRQIDEIKNCRLFWPV